MKKTVLTLAVMALALLTLTGCNAKKERRYVTRTITNPVLAGFYPDPSVTRGADGYYMVNSTFGYFPGIPIFYSADLTGWEQIGHVLHRPEQVQFDKLRLSNQGTYAPAIEYHDGSYYVACTEVVGRGNYIVKATHPAGPWSDPYLLPEVNGIDPSLFFDDDGKVYLVYNSDAPDNNPLWDGHCTIRMVEMDMKTMKVKSEPLILVNGGVDIDEQPVWIEGPHIYKVNDRYYLSAAEGGTEVNHSQVIFRSDAITGPYLPWEKNPILTQRHLDPERSNPITSTGHTDMIQDLEGNWWAFFLGCRPYDEDHFNTGRETFMAPVEWVDGWPVINPGHEEIQYSYTFTAALPGEQETAPRQGNFVRHDAFDTPGLAHDWTGIRAGGGDWFSIDTTEKVLQLQLLPADAMREGVPSYLAQRQHHMTGYAATAVSFTPASDGEKAGIAVLQNEERFYYLCKGVEKGRAAVQLYRSGKDGDSYGMTLLASAPLTGEDDSPLRLQIVADRTTYRFLYTVEEGDEWNELGGAQDARYLSTASAGGFVGCTYGLWALTTGKEPSGNHARYHWYAYAGNDAVYSELTTPDR